MKEKKISEKGVLSDQGFWTIWGKEKDIGAGRPA